MPEESDQQSSSVKDEEVYEALRDDGASKEKAARIANASANESRSEVGHRGGKAGSYEDWTVDELHERARELDIEGRSSMNKDELIKALRDH
ncbi:MAG TPA: Rho termination factor N-terminal domain-containing protein [Candidatus Dietzia intestinigallinarum]|nr:Rho termination factor N-terminal domain-containing protein [Candidatus Dietzia intestinigallinarum]